MLFLQIVSLSKFVRWANKRSERHSSLLLLKSSDLNSRKASLSIFKLIVFISHLQSARHLRLVRPDKQLMWKSSIWKPDSPRTSSFSNRRIVSKTVSMFSSLSKTCASKWHNESLFTVSSILQLESLWKTSFSRLTSADKFTKWVKLIESSILNSFRLVRESNECSLSALKSQNWRSRIWRLGKCPNELGNKRNPQQSNSFKW